MNTMTSPIPKIIGKHQPEFVDKVSPFFSLLEKYFRYELRGLRYIPKKGRAMIVMNHGIIPFHGFLMAKKIIEELGVYPRGLGADFLFHIPGVREFFIKGGAVKANPRNAERLLKEDQLVMLAPGGIYEALVVKPGMRRIPWERRRGFVRVAIKTETPIIPSFCQGINSAYFNSYFLLRKRIKLLEKSRFSLPFFFGLGFCPLPVKLVHFVGPPISVSRKPHESKAAQVERIHLQVLEAMKALVRRKD